MTVMIDIHADDYGYSINTSRDILECMKEGRLTSISIMGNMLSFEESMTLLYETIPSLPFLPLMSVHLNIPEGLFEEDGLPLSWERLFLYSYSPKSSAVKKAIKKELRLQIEKTQKAIEKCFEIAERSGVKVSQHGIRLDSHIHTHLVPVVWRALTELIEEEDYDIEYIRNPKEPILPFMKHPALWTSYGLLNFIKNRILMFYSHKVDDYCEKHNLGKMYMWGLMMSGHMDLDRIRKLYPDMVRVCEKNNRKLEILFHPGRCNYEDFGEDMGKKYFESFNVSENRIIEKETVRNIDTIIN